MMEDIQLYSAAFPIDTGNCRLIDTSMVECSQSQIWIKLTAIWKYRLSDISHRLKALWIYFSGTDHWLIAEKHLK